jgi:hypothetical protein
MISVDYKTVLQAIILADRRFWVKAAAGDIHPAVAEVMTMLTVKSPHYSFAKGFVVLTAIEKCHLRRGPGSLRSQGLIGFEIGSLELFEIVL